MQQETVTLIVAGLGIGGTLGGIVVGHFLTKSWQREQWLLDCRKEEFRELLKVLTRSFATICFYSGMRVMVGDEKKAQEAAQTDAQTTIRDRIYIADDIARLDIYKIWRKATDEFQQDRVYIAFSEKYALIRAMIIKAATDKL